MAFIYISTRDARVWFVWKERAAHTGSDCFALKVHFDSPLLPPLQIIACQHHLAMYIWISIWHMHKLHVFKKLFCFNIILFYLRTFGCLIIIKIIGILISRVNKSPLDVQVTVVWRGLVSNYMYYLHINKCTLYLYACQKYPIILSSVYIGFVQLGLKQQFWNGIANSRQIFHLVL